MLTVCEAMQAAGFSKEEASTKLMQQKVARTLPGHSKSAMKVKTSADLPLIELNCNDNSKSSLSQLMDPSGMHHEEEDIEAWKPKKHRSNYKQAQKKHESYLLGKMNYSMTRREEK